MYFVSFVSCQVAAIVLDKFPPSNQRLNGMVGKLSSYDTQIILYYPAAEVGAGCGYWANLSAATVLWLWSNLFHGHDGWKGEGSQPRFRFATPNFFHHQLLRRRLIVSHTLRSSPSCFPFVLPLLLEQSCPVLGGRMPPPPQGLRFNCSVLTEHMPLLWFVPHYPSTLLRSKHFRTFETTAHRILTSTMISLP